MKNNTDMTLFRIDQTIGIIICENNVCIYMFVSTKINKN